MRIKLTGKHSAKAEEHEGGVKSGGATLQNPGCQWRAKKDGESFY